PGGEASKGRPSHPARPSCTFPHSCYLPRHREAPPPPRDPPSRPAPLRGLPPRLLLAPRAGGSAGAGEPAGAAARLGRVRRLSVDPLPAPEPGRPRRIAGGRPRIPGRRGAGGGPAGSRAALVRAVRGAAVAGDRGLLGSRR